MPEKAQNPESKVIPLSLQLLFRKCRKAQHCNRQQTTKNKKYESGDNLVVETIYKFKQMVKTSSGVGLNNINNATNYSPIEP
ncbi:hypothetical protein QWY92_20295 [Algibacter miyuki]|uniref:hypothetical protein n=1 Tax=Algibacter miyuki TaxID=1306933 RepID=UPI0025B31A41|nr:hypothetical protein [Algibacter miyuki]MDN3667715.1 hypothetical protein [Algibacter miyuki]